MRVKLPFGLSPVHAIVGALVVAAFFGGTLLMLNLFFPSDSMQEGRPTLTALAPLQPVTRTSMVIAPVAVGTLAIRDVMEANAPRGLNGKRDNPLSELLGKAEIGWTAARGPIGVQSAPPGGLNITTTINGSLRATGQIANAGGNLTGAVGGLLGNNLGRNVQQLTTRALDQRADIRANVAIVSRPTLQPNWRIEPNLSGNVTMGDSGMTIAGIKLNVLNEVKPMLDGQVNEQIGKLSATLRADRTLEVVARREWTKMCRSISLGAAAGPNAPALWLEMRPTKAIAAQPRIVPDWVILTVGVQAETRIVPTETKPNCPFPAQLEMVQQLDQGSVAITVPIDVPFTELNRIMEAQLKDKTFKDARSAGEVTVLAAKIAASGDRLLVSLRVKAKETKSWFGLGAEATVHVWGRPTLDRDSQIMRLTDITLDVRSEAAFGLLGTAARAAIPYVQKALTDNAVVDLKPFAVSAQKAIEAAINDFRTPVDGVEVEAGLSGLRLTGIEFDSNTLRVTGEAQGTARALVRKIAMQ